MKTWILTGLIFAFTAGVVFGSCVVRADEPFHGITHGWGIGVDSEPVPTFTRGGSGFWANGVFGLVCSFPKALWFQGTHTNDGLDALLYLPMAPGRGFWWTLLSVGDVGQGLPAQFINGGDGWAGYRPLGWGCHHNGD